MVPEQRAVLRQSDSDGIAVRDVVREDVGCDRGVFGVGVHIQRREMLPTLTPRASSLFPKVVRTWASAI